MSENTQAAAANSAPPGAVPIFYTEPMPVAASLQPDWKIRPEHDFTFAARANTVPLTAPEFMMAARHFPIIFLGDIVPTCVLGFQPNSNLFVDREGQWERGAYVPAYIRRYPFILLGQTGDETLRLGIDRAGRSSKPDARALFEDGKETPIIKQAVEMGEQFHNAHMYTRDLSAALKAADVMEESTLQAEVEPGKMEPIASFKRVSEEKFRQLPEATILDWWKKGFMHAVYFHLQSMNNWEMLMLRNTRGWVPPSLNVPAAPAQA